MTFGELREGLGKKLGVEIEDAGGAFALEIDGQAVVVLQAGDGLLLVRADLGEIPPDRRDAIALAAMEANYLYQGTGGATLAVNPGDGHLNLQRYNWLERVDTDKAMDALSRFADTAAAWKRLVAEIPAAEVSAPPDLGPGGLMQV
ncbi:MAG: type III secretion system chaperone [Kiritimatiellae bacterium]|nr:type III secretion system chaperone [Kiritimatiellia bacterium]